MVFYRNSLCSNSLMQCLATPEPGNTHHVLIKIGTLTM